MRVIFAKEFWKDQRLKRLKQLNVGQLSQESESILRPSIINDRKLLRLIDREKKTQVEAAKVLGVSKQAVNQRLKELKGRTTRIVVAKEAEQIVRKNFDAIDTLNGINERTMSLLDEADSEQSKLVFKILSVIVR